MRYNIICYYQLADYSYFMIINAMQLLKSSISVIYIYKTTVTSSRKVKGILLQDAFNIIMRYFLIIHYTNVITL